MHYLEILEPQIEIGPDGEAVTSKIAKSIGIISAYGFTFDSGKKEGQIADYVAADLRELLGAGYGGKDFHIQTSDLRLWNCRIISDNGNLTFEFEEISRFLDGKLQRPPNWE
ncbi:hypothetical protein [Myxococcus sp. CA040A]|uniref:hypothetical protein n=1 Tax=Myxococcus sp. CA040A TaxID=2741738 RepID=UPI00157A8155|nr:hypothetical protein [Myxococcus sp. CA040A]NTX01730.1 hypothetical protein [Myxococcus sp. CA040A]